VSGELVATTPDVIYQLELATPAGAWLGRATVASGDGAVSFAAWQPEQPPAWLVTLAETFLRGEWRARRGDDAPPWPARIQRWRPEK
jgi:hypothetical protein